MSTIAAPDRSPVTSSRSASALNLIGGTWVEGRGNTSRDLGHDGCGLRSTWFTSEG
jgi:malonate-semialdehyde dehydrogenase (acetylating)/methylmalonate-semialdehyde dehydrogenase